MSTPEQLTQLATTLFAQGKLEAAEKMFADMLAQEPHNYEVLLMLGLCRHRQRDTEGALDYMHKALELGDSDPETHFFHGRVLLETGQHGAAREALAQALSLNPNHAPARTLMGLLSLMKGQVKQAVEDLHAAVRVLPDYVPALATLAIALLEQGEVDKAYKFASRAVKLDERSTSAQGAMGRVLLAQGHHGFAEQCFANALKIQPENPELNAGMGTVLQAAGRDEEALPHFQKALEAGYGGLKLTMDMALSLARTRRIGRARELMEQAHARLPENPEIRFHLAEYRLHASDLEGARELVGDAPADEPRWLLLRARIALAAAEPDSARELITDLLQHEDGAMRRSARLLIGRVALAQRDREAGRAALGELLETDPPDTEAALLWVDICQASGSEAEAEKAMEKLLSGDAVGANSRGRLNAALAWIKDRRGDHAGAGQHLAVSGWRSLPMLRRLEEQEKSGFYDAWRKFEGKVIGVPAEGDTPPAPVIVLGWPGSGRELILTALAGHPDVRLMDTEGIERRRDSLGVPMWPQAVAEWDSSAARLARKRFMRGFAGNVANIVALESAWWEISALPALARLFPGAPIVVPSAAIGDLELHWRFCGYAEIDRLRRACEAEVTLYEHLADRLELEFIPVTRRDLLEDCEAALRALCEQLDLDFRPELVERAESLRQSRPYRPDGHCRYYAHLLG